MLTGFTSGKQTGLHRKNVGAIARLGGLARGLLLLAGLGGGIPLASQITPPTAASPGDWTWMNGSNTLGSGNQGVSGVYPNPLTSGTFGPEYFPGGRWGVSGWIDSNNHLWLFGGFGFAGNLISGNGVFGDLNDLWQFDPTNNEWAYMGGGTTLNNNYCGESPTYGIQGVFSGTNVPGGRQNAASWIDKKGNLWLFGGEGMGAGTANSCGSYSFGYLNDLWEFNPKLGANGEWAWVDGPSTPNASGMYPAAHGAASGIFPGARYEASTWVDSNGNLWLYGGEGYDSGTDFGELNDLWEFNPTLGANGEWAWIDGSSAIDPYSGQPGAYGTMGVPATNNFPGGRYGASSWTDSSGNFWLFGGAGVDANNNSGDLDDLWEFNPTVIPVEWAWMSGSDTAGPPAVFGTMGTPATTNTPGGRYEASSWVDNSGNFWIFGGEGTGELNDLWAFNPLTSKWVWMGGSNTGNQPGSYGALQTPAETNIPGSRIESTSWTDSYSNFWLFGGDGHVASTSVVGALNDLWVYPPPTICWGPPSAIQISTTTLPVGFVGESYFENLTATGGCGNGYTWNVSSGTALSAVSLSLTSAGVISGTPNAAETAAPFVVNVVDPQGNTGSQDYTLTIYPDILVAPTSLLAGTQGTPYSQLLTASGGAGGPFTFSVASGTALSAVGLSLSSAGLISGTPSATETAAPFTLRIADSRGDFTQLNYTLTINSAVGQPAQVTDNETITVSDTETFPDVVDSEAITVTDSETVRAYNAIAITPSPATFNANSGNGYVSYAYSVPFTATGGIGTLTLTESGTLPAGLTFTGTALSGTPAVSSVGNTYTFSVTATDTDGDAVTVTGYSLTILAASAYPAMVTDNETITVIDSETFPDVVNSEPITVMDTDTVTTGPIITSPTTLAAGIVNVPYTAATFKATGGSGSYTWTSTGQPSGLNMSTAGVLSGTPTVAGMFSVTAIVRDSNGLSFSAVFSLAVTAPAPIANLSPTSLAFTAQPSGTASAAQAVTLSNTGSAPLSITGMGISISGANATDFSQTSPSCGTAVATGSSCAINVTFTPSLSAGPETATLKVADNASGTPQQVQLSGIALPPPSVSCTIPTINLSGDSGTKQITCTATDFTGTIALECNLPASLSAYVTCSFSPSSLNFASSITASTTLTIQPVQSASLERKSRPWTVSSSGVAFGAALWLPAWAFAMRRKKGRSKRGILFLLILFCGLPMITSCGGKSGPATPPAGTYQASVVLTGPGLNENISFTIQVP
jgi:hypothetical protein